MRDIIEVFNRTLRIDPLGLTIGDALEYMTLEQAKPYLKKEAVEKYESGKETWEHKDYTPNNVINDIINYLEFAWGKANNMRGLSAQRSIIHFSNWFYMFGTPECDELAEAILQYEYYGKPWLAIISELVGVDWKKYDDGWWSNCDIECDGLIGEKIDREVERYKEKIPFEKIKDCIWRQS